MEYKWHVEKQKCMKVAEENEILNNEMKKLIDTNEKFVVAMFRWQSTVLCLIGTYVFRYILNASLSR